MTRFFGPRAVSALLVPALFLATEGARSAPSAHRKDPQLLLKLSCVGTDQTLTVPVAESERTAGGKNVSSFQFGGATWNIQRSEPRVLLAERFVAAAGDPRAGPVLQIALRYNSRRTQYYLVPGSRFRGQVFESGAIVRCLSEPPPAEAKKRQEFFKNLFNGKPKILIEAKGREGRWAVPAEVGKRFALKDPAYEIEVLRRVSCFVLNPRTRKVVDQSSYPLNPACLLRVKTPAGERNTWLFSRLAEFSTAAQDPYASLRFVWFVPGHPHPRVEIVIFDSSAGSFPAVVCGDKAVWSVQLKYNEELAVGKTVLKVIKRLPKARLFQEFKKDPRGRPAVLLSWEAPDGTGSRWLGFARCEELKIGTKRIEVSLQVQAAQAHGRRPPQVLPRRRAKSLPPNHPRIPGTPR